MQHMIKMASFDTYEGKACRPMEQYARRDYVALKMLGSFVSGTLAFAIIFGTWALYSMERLMDEINTMDIPSFLTDVAVRYIVFLAVYLLITSVVYNTRYTAGRKKVKRYYQNVKKLNRIYGREEKLKTSEKKDWE